jgi:xanthine/CO dehydrogenase XdhC/CoxF family maturation factor
MSHNYSHDLALLRFLLASPARYIGVMGPRKRTERMLRELAANKANLTRLHSPVGLDIGANGPAEIALSIVAEMRAVLDGRRGGMLRERRGSIHGSPDDGECVVSTEEQVLPMVAA